MTHRCFTGLIKMYVMKHIASLIDWLFSLWIQACLEILTCPGHRKLMYIPVCNNINTYMDCLPLPLSWGCLAPQRWQRRLHFSPSAQQQSPCPCPPGRGRDHPTPPATAGPSLWTEKSNGQTHTNTGKIINVFLLMCKWPDTDISPKLPGPDW